MIKKGIISNVEGSYAAAFLPDEDNAVTPLLPFVNSIKPSCTVCDDIAVVNATIDVGDRCVIAFFDSDTINLADGVIIAVY